MNTPNPIDEKGLITIDTKELIIAKNDAGKFALTPLAEIQLSKLMFAKDIIDHWLEEAEVSLLAVMKSQDIVKIEGEYLSALRRFYGLRFEVYDRDMAIKGGFAEEVSMTKPNVTAIDAYSKANQGKLPPGIKLRERAEHVTVKDSRLEKKKKKEGEDE